MAQQYGPPHWLDDVIRDAVTSGSADAIAQAVARSDRFKKAINDGLSEVKQRPDIVPGPEGGQLRSLGPEQIVRRAIVAAIDAAS